MNSKVFIRIKEKGTGLESQEITIEDIIFNQDEIEFIFDEYDTDTFNGEFPSQLPYKDFLSYKDDYEVIVRIDIKEPCLKAL